MTCEDCVATVKRGLESQDGVLDVRISLKDGTGEVKLDQNRVQPEMLLKNKVFTKPSHYRATIEDQ